MIWLARWIAAGSSESHSQQSIVNVVGGPERFLSLGEVHVLRCDLATVGILVKPVHGESLIPSAFLIRHAQDAPRPRQSRK
jgi:hypothetical protein